MITINGKQYVEGSQEATNALLAWGSTMGITPQTIASAPQTGTVTPATATAPATITQPTSGVGSTAETNRLLGGTYFDTSTGSQIKPFTQADAQANMANYTIPTNTLQNQTPLPITTTPQPNYDADILAAGATDTSKQMTTTAQTALDAKIASEESKVNDLSRQLSSLLETSGGQGQATLDAENAAGIPQMQQQLQGVNSQIQTKLAEFNKIQSQYGELMQKNEMETIPMNLIIGKNAEVQRSLALQKNTFAAEIGLLQATAQGLQGQIELARQTADRAVDLKYQDIYRQIEIKQSQLGLVRDLLTADEKKKAAILDQQYQTAQNNLAIQVANEKDKNATLLNLIQEYPTAGILLSDTIDQATAKISAAPAGTSNNLMEISAGASLFDPATGKFIATAPKSYAPSSSSSNNGPSSSPTGVKFTATEQKNYEAFKSEIGSYANKTQALTDLSANKSTIITKIGQAGYDLLLKDINSYFTSSTFFPTIGGQTGPYSPETISNFLFK